MRPEAFPTVQLFVDLRQLLLGNLCLACLATGDVKEALDTLRKSSAPLHLATGEALSAVHPAHDTELQCVAALLEQQLNQFDRAVQRWHTLIQVRARVCRRTHHERTQPLTLSLPASEPRF